MCFEVAICDFKTSLTSVKVTGPAPDSSNQGCEHREILRRQREKRNREVKNNKEASLIFKRFVSFSFLSNFANIGKNCLGLE